MRPLSVYIECECLPYAKALPQVSSWPKGPVPNSPHSVQGYTFIEENFPGLFTADTGLPQALDDIKSKKNQFQRSKNFT